MSTTPSRDHVSPPSTSVPPNLGANKVRGSASPNRGSNKVGAPPKPDRTSCAYTFTNGHQCRMPRRSGHPYLCTFHARKEAQNLAADNVGQDIASYLSGAYISACDLNSALGRLFVAVAQGHIHRKTAATLAYLAQSLVQTLHLAQHEYINAFGTDSWRRTVRSSFDPPPPAPPQPQPTQPPAPAQPAPPPQNVSPARPAAASPTGSQAPCSGRSSDRPAPSTPNPSPTSQSQAHVASCPPPSAGAASPSRGHSHPANPGPPAASPTATQPSAEGASQVSPTREGWVTDPASPSTVGATQTSSHPPIPAHR